MGIRRPFLILLTALMLALPLPTVLAQPAARDLLGMLGGFVSPISQREEVIAGSQLDKQVREQYTPTTNVALQNYVSQIGKKIASHSQRDYPFSYTVLEDSRTANAFAGPGGFIYITTGMINMLENEAQLAAILGHETAHVTERHVVNQLQARQGTNLALLLLGRVADVNVQQNRVAQIGNYLLQQRFSRQDETEADLVGVQLMTRAGYNPDGMVQLLNKLNAMAGSGVNISFLQSHPSSQSRAELTAEFIERNNLRRPGQVMDTQNFHRIVR